MAPPSLVALLRSKALSEIVMLVARSARKHPPRSASFRISLDRDIESEELVLMRIAPPKCAVFSKQENTFS